MYDPFRKLISLLFLLSSGYALGETTIPASVTAGLTNTKFSIDGRIFLGMFVSNADGIYSNRTFDIPDAKLRFVIQPTENVILINRMSFSKTVAGGLDYCYLDLKNYLGKLPGHTFRIGKFKSDFGWELLNDNPIDAITVSNSISNVTGIDEGVMLFGKMQQTPLAYSFAVTNASKDASNSADGLAVTGKLSVFPMKQLIVSASGYSTGQLTRDSLTVECDLKVANLQKPPSGTTSWSRTIWEIDVLWNYNSSGSSIVAAAPSLPPYAIAAAYGVFNDECKPVPDRSGFYYFVEGLLRVSQSAFVSAKLSETQLDDHAKDFLGGSPIAVNRYQRLSVAGGYRISNGVIAKVEGSKNIAEGGSRTPDLDIFSFGFAVKF